jgi:rubrerythrin
LTELDLEDLRKARIWFSRYCFNPEKTLNEINSLVEEIGATQIVHTQESAKDTSSKSITQVQSHQSHGQVSYIELFWRCPECGTDHISAIPDLNPTGWYCPECFFRRDETVELYEAPDSRVITDPELIQQIEEGRADWKCKYCGSLNADEGYARDALACAVCGQPQMDFEESAPIRDQVGERIEFRSEDSAPVQSQTGEWIESRSDDRFSDSPSSLANGNDSPAQFSFPWRRVGAASTAVISSVGAIGVWWLSPRDLEVSVDTLPWEIQVDVEELRPVERSDWDERVPSTAKTIRTETRQRGTETVQRGTETIMVEERYQSGTTTETYTEQERYQSGTRQECTTQTTGTGAGKRTCRDVPVYSTRSVNKTRQVPVYATRQVPKEVPKMVEEPVYDTYVYYTVDEWKPIQTFTGEGYDDEPRLIPTPELHNQPYPQRVSQPRIVCHLTASYMEKQQPRVSTWKLPCDQFDLLNTGDRALLQVTRSGKVTLRKVLEE